MLPPRFAEWVRQWPEAVAETGHGEGARHEHHARFGPAQSTPAAA